MIPNKLLKKKRTNLSKKTKVWALYSSTGCAAAFFLGTFLATFFPRSCNFSAFCLEAASASRALITGTSSESLAVPGAGSSPLSKTSWSSSTSLSASRYVLGLDFLFCKADAGKSGSRAMDPASRSSPANPGGSGSGAGRGPEQFQRGYRCLRGLLEPN